MGSIRSYEDLQVWRKAMTLVEVCYRLTAKFPRQEMFGLTGQIRHASVSIPSNIAEGHCQPRGTYLRHLRIASGSQAEIQTQLEIARRLCYVSDSEHAEVHEYVAEVGRLLKGLIRSLRTPPQSPIPSP